MLIKQKNNLNLLHAFVIGFCRDEGSSKELAAYKQSGDLYFGLRWLLSGIAFMFIVHYITNYLEHFFTWKQ
jgi:hypothetical protein